MKIPSFPGDVDAFLLFYWIQDGVPRPHVFHTRNYIGWSPSTEVTPEIEAFLESIHAKHNLIHPGCITVYFAAQLYEICYRDPYFCARFSVDTHTQSLKDLLGR
jgi:hypothetical protein